MALALRIGRGSKRPSGTAPAGALATGVATGGVAGCPLGWNWLKATSGRVRKAKPKEGMEIVFILEDGKMAPGRAVVKSWAALFQGQPTRFTIDYLWSLA